MQLRWRRFRLRDLLIGVGIMCVLMASGVKPRRVGAMVDATSMPGYQADEVPIYQEGWLVRLIMPFFPTPKSDPSPVTAATQKTPHQ